MTTAPPDQGVPLSPVEAKSESFQERWGQSPELREIRVWRQILLILFFVAAVAAVVLWGTVLSKSFEYEYESPGPSTALWIAASSTTLAAAILGLVGFAQFGVARRKFEEREEQERREQLRADRDEQVSPGELGELLAANRALLDEYQKPVRAQARTSYVYGQMAILVGLAVLIVGGILILATGEAAARISVAGLAAVGSAVSGYVARTYLRVYDRAQEQLNFYFREPLVTSYLLTAERLAEKLDGDRKQDAYGLMVGEIVGFVRADLDPKSLARTDSPD